LSIASVSTLPHLEVTDAVRVLNEEEKKKRREARKKKEQEAKASNASLSEQSSSSKDGDDDESYQVHSKVDKKRRGKKNDENKYASVSFNYSSMSMTNHNRKSFSSVPVGKLPHFDGTNFAK
jgi:hypothetical protein